MASKRSAILEYMRGTLLPAITTGGGFNNTISRVERGLRYPDEINDSEFPAVFVAQTEETRQNLTKIHFQSDLSVSSVGFVKSLNGTSGAQLALDGLIEDLTKKLEADRQQGGLVNWTEIKRVKTDVGDLDPIAACAIEVHFTYTTEGANP